MANKVRKEPRSPFTVNMDNGVLAWLRNKPRNFQIQDFINDTLRHSIKTIDDEEKKVRLQELKVEQAAITAEVTKLEQEERKKEVEAQYNAARERRYAEEQQEITELNSTLDYFTSQGPEYKKFLQKLEYEAKHLPKPKVERLRAIKALLEASCLEGEGMALMERLKSRVA